MTNDIFHGPKLKIKRANRHIQELNGSLSEFLKTDFYSLSVEADAKSGNDLLVFEVTASTPEDIPLLVADSIHNLRCALDLLMCAIVRDAGGNDSRASFPFHETRENLADAIEKGEIKKTIPELANFILDTVKPYRTGNFPLWALNKLDIIDKHRIIYPVFSITKLMNVTAVDDNYNSFSFGSIIVNRQGKYTPIETAANLHIKNYGQPAFAVFFDKGLPFEGEPIVPTLHQLAELTAGIVQTFETFIVELNSG